MSDIDFDGSLAAITKIRLDLVEEGPHGFLTEYRDPCFDIEYALLKSRARIEAQNSWLLHQGQLIEMLRKYARFRIHRREKYRARTKGWMLRMKEDRTE